MLTVMGIGVFVGTVVVVEDETITTQTLRWLVDVVRVISWVFTCVVSEVHALFTVS